MENIEILKLVVNVLFTLIGIYIAYNLREGKKTNNILQIAYDIYQKVRKLNLSGVLDKDKRLEEGLKLAENELLSSHRIQMDSKTKKLVSDTFASLHAKDKNAELLMNSVAVEPKKKE